MLFSFEGMTQKRRSGDDSKEEPPVPMPNTEVKLLNVDDTWWVTAWESRKLPELMPVGQAVKTPPFHGGNAGSIPARVTNILNSLSCKGCLIYLIFMDH